MTLLYTAHLAGEIALLPRLFTLIGQERRAAAGPVILLDMGDTCAVESWVCRATQGRAPFLVLDSMGYDAALIGLEQQNRTRYQTEPALVYGVIMAGWASNSKYPFLAALRSAAQMVSYEVSIGFVIITVLLCAGSLNLSKIVEAQNGPYGVFSWYWLPLFPMFVVFFISALAETNRPPFDLVEAESELVAGFMVEYGSTPYMMFMLGEYVAIGTMCAMGTILFLGGWLSPIPYPPVHLGARRDLVRAEGVLPVFPVRHGQGHGAPLSLRPTDAAGLEGVPAAVVGHGGDRRSRYPIRRPGDRSGDEVRS